MSERGWLHPDAPFALAVRAISELQAAMQAEHAVRMLIAHPPTTLAPEAVAQRNTILKISAQILRNEAIKYGDEFATNWNDYKQMLRNFRD